MPAAVVFLPRIAGWGRLRYRMCMVAPDPIELTQALVRCASVTPDDAGALGYLSDLLSSAGFETAFVRRGGIENLVARWGKKGHRKTFGFNGHTDVVPPGDPEDWTYPPFSAVMADGMIWGRGSCDMKSGVAAFVAAAVAFVSETPPEGAILITVTGDEEGVATDGTSAILDWMADHDEAMSVCLVGEPTCPSTLGEAMKIGRRGSMTAYFTAEGIQGHSAYPHNARNPIPAMAGLMSRLATHELDQGTDHFDPSTLAVTTIDTGNPANNVIPASCTSTVNIRFNDAHTSATLIEWLEAEAKVVTEETGVSFGMTTQVSGESFVTEPGSLSALVAGAVEEETGLKPDLSTSGGTSDARFIQAHCPVVEFGLVGKSMHKVDEHVSVDDVTKLTRIYRRILEGYFA